MTFDKLFEQYEKSPGFRSLSERSTKIYISAAAKFSKYINGLDVAKIKRSDLMRFLNDHSDTPAQANLTLRVVSVVFSFAVDMDILQYNPASRIKKLKIGSHVKWSPEEVREMISRSDRIISTAIAIAWYTGQREGDVLNLRWADCQDGYIRTIQSKTKMEMMIKIHPDLAAYLEGIRGAEPSDYFIVSGARKINGPAFRNRLKRKTDKLHIDKVFHGIRKGVASSLAESGRSIKEIAAILGHKSIRMAAYYADQADNKTLTDSAVDSMVGVAA